jgi:hypothetical protein
MSATSGEVQISHSIVVAEIQEGECGTGRHSDCLRHAWQIPKLVRQFRHEFMPALTPKIRGELERLIAYRALDSLGVAVPRILARRE